MYAARIFRARMNSTEGTVAPVILFEDAWMLAVSKPAGMPVQSDPTGDVDLVSWLRDQLKDPGIQLVHRIDRPVSGVVLLARSPEALPVLHAMFRERRMQKHYWAIVEGRVQLAGTLMLEHSLEHDQRSHRSNVIKGSEEGTARTHVRVVAQGDRYTLVEAVPEGGAFHQIRAQLGAWGHPIKGDVKYGARRGEKDRSIGLHARSLRFVHPFTGTDMSIAAPCPATPLWSALVAAIPAG